MSKPSFTQAEQITKLSKKWAMDPDLVREMLRDVREMDADALVHGERVYWDDFGTVHVEIKPPTWKRLPGAERKTLVFARVNVKFEESQNLIEKLNDAFRSELEESNKAVQGM